MTFFPCVIFYVLIILCSKRHVSEGLYGGRAAKGSEAPWTVLITFGNVKGGPHEKMCSGSLISSELILTAAHCVQWIGDGGAWSYGYMTVHAGVTLGSTVQKRNALFCAARKIQKPFKAGSHDFAIIKVDKPFQLTYGVKPIKLATENFQPGTECVMVGHGMVSPSESTKLLAMMAKMIQVACTQEVTACPPSEINGPEPKDICPIPNDGIGLCHGDSGSALVCNGSIYGVAHAISYRNNATSEEKNSSVGQSRCGKEYVMSIYVGVYPSRVWLHKAIASLEAASSAPPLNRLRFPLRNETAVARVLQPLLISTILSYVLKA